MHAPQSKGGYLAAMKRKVSITVTLNGSRGGFTLRTDTVTGESVEISGRMDMMPDDRRLVMECVELIGMTARNGTGSHLCRRGLSELTSASLCMVLKGAAGNLEATDVRKGPGSR